MNSAFDGFTPPVRPLPTEAEAYSGIVLTCAATLTPQPVAWLWTHWLALGKLHILAGSPGQGKTTLALAMAAIVTQGGRWPDGSRSPMGNVLMWSGEDDPADTLLPRLVAMGSDPARVFFVTGARVDNDTLPFDPARDMPELLAAAERIGDVRLLIVDPVVSAVTGDSHKNTEVRRAMQPLVDLGAALGAAVLGITHFSKGSTGRDPTERVVGSMAFGAVARVVLCAAKIRGKEGEEDRRILVRSKSNIGPDEGGFEYGIDQIELDAYPGVVASRVEWRQAIDGTARELLADAEGDQDGEAEPAEDVDAFVRGCLLDGPKPANAVKRDADGAGYSWRTVQRAAQRLHVERRKEGMKGGWVWALTNSPKAPRRHEGAEDVSLHNVAPSQSSVASSGAESEFLEIPV